MSNQSASRAEFQSEMAEATKTSDKRLVLDQAIDWAYSRGVAQGRAYAVQALCREIDTQKGATQKTLRRLLKELGDAT